MMNDTCAEITGIAVISAVIVAISMVGIRPLGVGLGLSLAMLCVYAAMLAYFGRSSCIEMGIATIILTVLAIGSFGVAGGVTRHRHRADNQKVEPAAAASPRIGQ